VNFETLGLQVLLQEIAKLGIVIYDEQPGVFSPALPFSEFASKMGSP
jgi:hypothetical protein